MKDKQFVLVVIDVQGKLARVMYDSDILIKNLIILIKGTKLLDIPIIWTEQVPEKLGKTVPEIAELLAPNTPVIKSVFSCARDDDFMKALDASECKHVLICGIETHVCVYQTAIDLLDMGYQVNIVADAVSSRTKNNKEIGMDRIILAGGNLTSVETVLFEVQEVAAGDRFRELIKIVK